MKTGLRWQHWVPRIGTLVRHVIDTAPPEITAESQDMTVECDGLGNTAELNAWLEANGGATATDVCGNVVWTNDFQNLPIGSDGTGSVDVTFTATDECGNASITVATFAIEDATGPVVTVGDVIELWPPNHKYRTFDLENCVMNVQDQCGGTLDVQAAGSIVSISSDEPENVGGNGDGNTVDDMVILGLTSFKVRSERQGGGNGRVYTVNFAVVDLSGNVSMASCVLAVAHDKNGDPAVDDGPAAGYLVNAP